MDLRREVDDYIRESIEQSLGLPVSTQTLVLKLLASEESRRRLLDNVFMHQERLNDVSKKLHLSRAEALMSAQALKRCIEEKAALGMRYADLESHLASLEEDRSLYEKDRERIMDACVELEKGNIVLKMQVEELTAEIISLHKAKECLRINLLRAEDEVKVLDEQNKVLERENQKLIKSLKERRHQGSVCMTSTDSAIIRNYISIPFACMGQRPVTITCCFIFSFHSSTYSVTG